MTIDKILDGGTFTIALAGRLDTSSAPQLEEELKSIPEEADRLVFDFTNLDYLSSAGLRLLLIAQKMFLKRGGMTVCGVNDDILEIFSLTGFDDILTIEKPSAGNELTIEATVPNIAVVTQFVDAQLEALDCPMKAQTQIDIAIDELFGNIAQYAYNPDTGPATVRVEVENDPMAVVITFIDHGVPYDPLAAADPDLTLSAEERAVGGLGVFLVKKTMDDVTYEYKDGQNILRIKKHI